MVILLALALPAFTQDSIQHEAITLEEGPYAGNNPPAEDFRPGDFTRIDSPWKDIEFLNSIIVIVFGLSILLLIGFRLKPNELASEDFFRLLILTLVIIATMYLIAAGWDNRQTAPAFGILGTIAGFLLGRQSNIKKDE